MGRIGHAIKKRTEPFGLTTIYHNRTPLPSEQTAGADYVPFETLLRKSDIISVNIPLTPSTKRLISASAIAVMNPGVVIINTARGDIIDEAAMADALESGAVRLDV